MNNKEYIAELARQTGYSQEERMVVNPTTKKRQLVPPKLVLAFRPVAAIKEKLKNGGVGDE